MPGLAGECSWPQYCPLLGFVLFVTAICFSLLMARNIFSSLFPSFWFYISIWNETLTPFKSHSLCTCINGRVHSLAANRPALNKSETFFLSSFAVDNNPALALHDQPRWQLMTEKFKIWWKWHNHFASRASSLRHCWLHPAFSLHRYFWQMPICSLDEFSQAIVWTSKQRPHE